MNRTDEIMEEMRHRIEENDRTKEAQDRQDAENMRTLNELQQKARTAMLGDDYYSAMTAKAELDKVSSDLQKQLAKRPKLSDNITELWKEYKEIYSAEFEEKLAQYEKKRAELLSLYEDLLIMQGSMLQNWNGYRYGMALFTDPDALRIDAPMVPDKSNLSGSKLMRKEALPADFLLYAEEADRRGDAEEADRCRELKRKLYAYNCAVLRFATTPEEIWGDVADEVYLEDRLVLQV